MEYQLVISPSLGITPGDFVEAWNEDGEMQAAAQARLVPSANRAYNDPLLDAVWLIVSTLGGGIATNALYDLIKQTIVKKGHHKRTKITKLDQPDGTHLLIIEEEE